MSPLNVPILLASLLAILSVGSPARLLTRPAVNKEIAQQLIQYESVSLGDFIQPGARVPSSAVILFFFNRSQGGDDLLILNRLAKRHTKNKVQILAISTETGNQDDVDDWVALQDLNFPVLRDNHQIVFGRYEIQKLPMTIIVDKNGRMVSIGNPTGSTLESEIDAGISMLVGD